MTKKGLIVYFVPPKQIVNGGVLSIFSQCKEARQFYDIHHSETVICTYPGMETYAKNNLFSNDEIVHSFDEVIAKWPEPDKLLLQIPECAVMISEKALREKYLGYLNAIKSVHINVMTQNIKLLPNPLAFAELFRITPNITQTTAHTKYTTQELSNAYQTPVHHLSVFVDKSQYVQMDYWNKKNIIVNSPDNHPQKNEILRALNNLDSFEIREIKGLTYVDYKRLIANAKFCITFGEGFDGYFVESFLSGSIGMAVYNDIFFPNRDFLHLPSVFTSYKTMSSNICETVKSLDNEKNFNRCIRQGVSKIEKLYRYDIYIKKMEAFYRGHYDFYPTEGHPTDMLVTLVDSKDLEIRRLENREKELTEELKLIQQQAEAMRKQNEALDSRGWRFTEPFRKIRRHIKRIH